MHTPCGRQFSRAHTVLNQSADSGEKRHNEKSYILHNPEVFHSFSRVTVGSRVLPSNPSLPELLNASVDALYTPENILVPLAWQQTSPPTGRTVEGSTAVSTGTFQTANEWELM